jgi:hypothetical protein
MGAHHFRILAGASIANIVSELISLSTFSVFGERGGFDHQSPCSCQLHKPSLIQEPLDANAGLSIQENHWS